MFTTATVLASLAATSGLIGGALAIAWRRWGREPHAALWAAGFLLTALGHASQLARLLLQRADAPLFTVAAVGCLSASMALLALGFRFRAGLRGGARLIAGAAVAITAGVAGASLLLPGWPVQRVATAGFGTAMLIVSAVAVRTAPGVRRAGSAGANGAASWLLLGFAAYCAALVGAALAVRDGGPVTDDVYRFLFLAGVPTGMTAVGLSALLLLGGDLAERLHRLAEVDPLTGLLNRRGMQRAASRLIAQTARAGRPLAVVVADLDRFKAINDSFGHAFGDVMLTRFAGHAAGELRGGDLLGRVGGEEFVFVLADTGAEQAADAMHRLRAALRRMAETEATPVALTASFGISALADRGDTLELLVARADEALYRSKHEGRDRVSFAEPRAAAGEPRFRGVRLRDAGGGRADASRRRGSRR